MLLGPIVVAAVAATESTRRSPVQSEFPVRVVRSLDATQMFGVAEDYLRRGSRDKAEAVLALLSRDPNADIRNEARFRYARLLQSSGKTSAAAMLLRQILDEKPSAAAVRLQLAQILERLGDTSSALRELRAAQAAGLPPNVARLVDRYSQALRAARPAGASIEIALAPDNNINRATRSDTLGTVLGDFDIDEDGKAKSGTGLALRGQIYRRIVLGGDASLLGRISGSADLYLKGRFNDIAVDAALGPELHLGRNQLNLELGATNRWFGQKVFMRSARIGATWARPLGTRMQARLHASATLIDNRFNDLQDGKAYSGQIELERALSPTTGIGASFTLDRQSLKDPGYSTTGWRAGLLGWRDVGRMTLTAGAELGRLHADERLMLFPDKRTDHYSRLTIGATFRQLTYRGFAPLMRLSIERNRSTVEFYDYKRVRTEFGISRAF